MIMLNRCNAIIMSLAAIGFVWLTAAPARASAFKASDLPDVGVRVRVRQVGERPVREDDSFTIALAGMPALAFKGGNWSPWAETTPDVFAKALSNYPNSYNHLPEMKLGVTVKGDGKGLFPLHLDVETWIDGGEKNVTPAELVGPALGILVWRDKAGALHIDTLAGHGRRIHDAAMRAAELPPADRPRKIIFGERYIGGDSDAICQREGIARLCGLGFNTMHAVPREFTGTVREGGISNLWGAVYNPPGYAFNYDTNRAAIFRDFVAGQVGGATNAGWARGEIAMWVTSDEPGWYYPRQYKTLNDDALALADFHAYLQRQGLKPRDLGAASWDEVRAIGRKEYSSLEQRRLFYWANRYIPWASSRFFAEVTRAYEAELGTNFPVMVNFNNFMGRLYQPGAVGNNADKDDPNAGMGQHDWLEFGRVRGSTCIATEDWFGDADAAQWSFYATRLRSAAEYGGVGFGALVIPRTSGQRPEGMAQKLLALVGQGAKNIKFFTFGPEYNFPGNCYDYNTAVYKPLALGMGIVGRAEELLYPGRMPAPAVALLMPQSAQLWDLEEMEKARGLMDVTNAGLFGGRMAYEAEVFGIHLALQHSAIPVQAIDEENCGNGGRDLARYRVVYATAPDIPEEAADGLLKWVNSGGTLVLLAGSGLFDRYHQPLDKLARAAGSAPAAVVRPLLGGLAALRENGTVSFGAAGAACFGERETLNVGEAEVAATFDDGGAALTKRPLGKGHIFRFAMFAGTSYRRSATQSSGGLPSGFAPLWREMLTLPVREAAVAPPVSLDRPLIEAQTLLSDRGAAVTLLNWSGAPQEGVRVTLRTDTPPQRVESARRGRLEFSTSAAAGGGYRHATVITLNMDDVDVLSFYYGI